MPILSIIIPVYNTEQFLPRCLDSILNQSFKDYELILVNDGSKDNSRAICEDYAQKDSRIKVINQENQGAGPARNAGIELAVGKYIAFPDSDDWLDPETYQTCVEQMELHNSNLLVFGMSTHVFNNEKNVEEQIVEDSIPNIVISGQKECRKRWAELHSKMDLGSPANKIYCLDIIKKNGIKFPPLRRMQDCVFNIYYFDKVTVFASIGNNFYHRTWHSAVYQRKKMPKAFIECAITYHKTLMQYLEKWGVLDNAAKTYFGENFSEVIMTAEFEYLPENDLSFLSLYHHIKVINGNSYIHEFFKDYKRIKGALRKKEIAIMNKWNFLLTLDYCLSIWRKSLGNKKQ